MSARGDRQMRPRAKVRAAWGYQRSDYIIGGGGEVATTERLAQRRAWWGHRRREMVRKSTSESVKGQEGVGLGLMILR